MKISWLILGQLFEDAKCCVCYLLKISGIFLSEQTVKQYQGFVKRLWCLAYEILLCWVANSKKINTEWRLVHT